jgi:hypothetical protein
MGKNRFRENAMSETIRRLRLGTFELLPLGVVEVEPIGTGAAMRYSG